MVLLQLYNLWREWAAEKDREKTPEKDWERAQVSLIKDDGLVASQHNN